MNRFVCSASYKLVWGMLATGLILLAAFIIYKDDKVPVVKCERLTGPEILIAQSCRLPSNMSNVTAPNVGRNDEW